MKTLLSGIPYYTNQTENSDPFNLPEQKIAGSEIDNNSSVSGPTVTDALNYLLAHTGSSGGDGESTDSGWVFVRDNDDVGFDPDSETSIDTEKVYSLESGKKYYMYSSYMVSFPSNPADGDEILIHNDYGDVFIYSEKDVYRNSGGPFEYGNYSGGDNFQYIGKISGDEYGLCRFIYIEEYESWVWVESTPILTDDILDRSNFKGDAESIPLSDTISELYNVSMSVASPGNQNTREGSYPFVGGGTLNVATGDSTVIAGGMENSASSLQASVLGGRWNHAAGQHSSVLGGMQNISSGEYSVSAGIQNLASGVSSVAVGFGNTASAEYSTVIGGRGAVASINGMEAHACGFFSKPGDAQRVSHVLKAETPGGSVTLTVDGSNPLVIPEGKIFAFTAKILGTSQFTMSKSFMYIRQGMIKNVEGTVSLVGTVATIGTDIENAGDEDVDVVITADTLNSSLKFNIQSVISHSMYWVAHVEGVEIGI